MENYKFMNLLNGIVVNIYNVIGIQPTDKENEFYVHTTTSQYYKIGLDGYNAIKRATPDFINLPSGLVVNLDYIVGVQPYNDNEYYIHTTTSQYYRIDKNDYNVFLSSIKDPLTKAFM